MPDINCHSYTSLEIVSLSFSCLSVCDYLLLWPFCHLISVMMKFKCLYLKGMSFSVSNKNSSIFGPCNEVHHYYLHFIKSCLCPDPHEQSGKLGSCPFFFYFFFVNSINFTDISEKSLQGGQRQTTDKMTNRHLLESEVIPPCKD